MIDPAAGLAFSMYENKGVYALLLGSGVSRASQIPTGWEIIGELARQLAVVEDGIDPGGDWPAWYQRRFDGEPSYSRLLDLLAPTQDERRALIQKFIDPEPRTEDETRRAPSKAHHAIARLVADGYVRVIITTNFDRLMEQALAQVGVAPVVLKSDDDIRGARPLIHTPCTILKVHGDYLDTRLRNTEDELSGYSAEQDALLDRILDEHGLVVAGWSGDWDQALRAAIGRAQSRRFTTYWASRGQPSTAAQELLAHRQGRLVGIEDADSFFIRLGERLKDQADLNCLHPLSTNLLVAAAKRYLPRPEHRIQLVDLVAEEARRADEAVRKASVGDAHSASVEDLMRLAQVQEAAYEPLARVLYVMGRFGLGDEVRLATEVLQRLGASSWRGGDGHLLALRSYPAVLALYAYGLGLAQADRRDVLHQWWRTPLRRENRHETPRAVENLYLWNWTNAGTETWWRHLDPRVRDDTQVSDHLFNLFSDWLHDGFLSLDDLAFTFDLFEATGMLTELGLNLSVATLEELLGRSDEPIRVPVGRLAYSSDRKSVIEALAGGDTRAATLAAGFCRGEERHLILSMQNFERVLKYIARHGF